MTGFLIFMGVCVYAVLGLIGGWLYYAVIHEYLTGECEPDDHIVAAAIILSPIWLALLLVVGPFWAAHVLYNELSEKVKKQHGK